MVEDNITAPLQGALVVVNKIVPTKKPAPEKKSAPAAKTPGPANQVQKNIKYKLRHTDDITAAGTNPPPAPAKMPQLAPVKNPAPA